MTHSLRQTIYIDFDQIEATTLNHCSDMGALATPDFIITQSRGNTPPMPDLPTKNRRSMATVADQIMANEGLFNSSASELGNEADKMLEQAEALSVEFHPHGLLNLGGSDGDWATMNQ